MYGNRIPASEYHPRRSVIGAIDTTTSGNVVLRIGAMFTNDPERGWQQTEHVVLQTSEIGELIRDLVEVMPATYGETLGFRFDRELAGDVLHSLDGATVIGERLDDFRQKLADFVGSEQP